MVEWVWRQIGVELPAEWECLQFARDPEAGRCAFADRHRYRFELNWRRSVGEPDFGRMMKDYEGALAKEWEGIRKVKCRGWPGLTGNRGGEVVSRFGRWLAGVELLVEVVFIHPDRRDARLEAKVLQTVREVPPEATGLQCWRAFGMEMRVPRTFELGECVVEPARVGMRFDGPNGPDRWIFRRYGMVDSWLKTSVREWLVSQAGELVRNVKAKPGGGGAAQVERIEGEWRPKGLLLRKGAYAAAAWREPEDGRLYHAICITGKKMRRFHPVRGADHVLTSCPEFLCVPEDDDA
ncbi:MAG: hypothetical protein PHU50_07795 [Kiritimatiellae bacterium]|nr:hypothetical protein [Kiritimatiellia bacterium]